jgi:predicted solute-binding protein
MVKLLQSLDAVDAGKQQKLIEVLDWVDFLDEREIYISMDKRITGKIKLDDDITYRLSYLKELYYNYIKPEERGMIDFFDEKYARFIAE